jgi:hypothetical protein
MREKDEGRSSRSPSDREAISKFSCYDPGIGESDSTCWRRAIADWLRWMMEVMQVAVPKFVGVVVVRASLEAPNLNCDFCLSLQHATSTSTI